MNQSLSLTFRPLEYRNIRHIEEWRTPTTSETQYVRYWCDWCLQIFQHTWWRLRVGPDDSNLLLGTRTVSPWNIVPHCPRVLQVLPTMSYSSQVFQLSQSQLSDSVEQCSMGTLSLVPRSKVASSGPTLRRLEVDMHSINGWKLAERGHGEQVCPPVYHLL